MTEIDAQHVDWGLRTLSLPRPELGTAEEREAVAEACGVVLNRLSEHGSEDYYRLGNDLVLLTLARLSNGKAAWPQPGGDPAKCFEREVLAIENAAAVENGTGTRINERYETHSVPEEARSAYESAWLLFVSTQLADNGSVNVWDVATGEERPAPGSEKFLVDVH